MATRILHVFGGAALALMANPGLAHTGDGGASGFVHGLMHLLLGPDHTLTMITVGVLAAAIATGFTLAIGLRFLIRQRSNISISPLLDQVNADDSA